MKNVCRWLSVVVMVCWCINVQSALALCFLEDLECLAPMLLPGYQKDVGDGHTLREWAPSAGKMYAFNDWIIAEFRFDQESIDILHGNNSFGLEFEAVVKGPNRNQVDVRWIYTTFPANAGVGYDTEVCDYVTNHGSESKVISVHVLNPSVLQKDVNYRVFFKLENRLPNSGVSIKPGVQITIDANYGPLLANLVVEQIPWLDQFQYYALETEHYIKFDIQPSQINGVCWDNKESSYDCSIGNDDNPPAIFIEGNHTHIIHDDYRCSKETNGPILCWEAGGDTNCWDGWKHYQFNGEIGEIAEHRADSDWITTLDRSMCAQVYNSSGSGTSIGGAWHSGGPYPDDPIYDNDPFVPNADVSIRYLEIKGPGQSNHHTESGAVFSPGQTQSVDLKGKIKNESNDNTDMARIQYCATTKKKFRHDERIWIDEDYLDHQEREHDFDPGESITKHGQAFITLASDLSSITVFKGNRSHTFPITQKHLYEKKIPELNLNRKEEYGRMEIPVRRCGFHTISTLREGICI